MKSFTSKVRLARAALATGLTLLAPGAARADITYTVQPIVKTGVTVAGVTVKKDGFIYIGSLNDRGQLIFGADNAAGGQALIQYADGTFTPIVVAGGQAPVGKWPKNVVIGVAVSMNAQGNAAFTVRDPGLDAWTGTYFWNATAQQVTPVALAGMPAANNLPFLEMFAGATTTINNRDEIAFGGYLRNAAGQPRRGAFLWSRDGKLVPLALPDQELPGGGQSEVSGLGTLSDAGVVAFTAVRPGDSPETRSAYLWEQGTITPIVGVGTEVPGGGKLVSVWMLRVNNKDRHLLVAATLTDGHSGPYGLYRLADGTLTPVAVPGQEMPGGGKFDAFQWVSEANAAGQHAFDATLKNNAEALYLLDADGKLSLILKAGMSTALGRITGVFGGVGIGLNTRGQVAVPVSIAGIPGYVLVLLTPVVP
jgi:hypothetical protein